jgi:thiol:disulfide interchange protein
VPNPKSKEMKLRLLSSIVLLLTVFQGLSQIYNPVKWKFDYQLDGDEYAVLKFTATIDQGWHVYATKLESDMGPIPTEIVFNEIKGATLVGGIVEPTPHKEYDPNFDMELSWFAQKVTLTQKVKLTAPMAKITGELTYMTCDDSKCLPPEYLDFNFDIEAAIRSKPVSKAIPVSDPEPIKAASSAPLEESTIPKTEANNAEPEVVHPAKWTFSIDQKSEEIFTLQAKAIVEEGWHVYSIHLPNEDGPIATELNFIEGSFELIGATHENGEVINEYDSNFMMELSYFANEVILEQDFKVTGKTRIAGEVYFMACDDERCTAPESIPFEIDPTSVSLVQEGDLETSEQVEADETSSEQRSGGLWGIFFLSFLGGFAALLTPCVFPMIPMTVSFFTKQSKTKAKGVSNAIIYSLFIIGIYTLLGFAVTVAFGADALNALSTNVWFNLAFFVLLVVFAISFLGAFEITLPSSFVNKVDQQSDKGGLVGIFFMAFTLALVSFSCTGPIIGTLLVEAAVNGGVAGPLVGMGGFSLALALPFGLFAAFPGWLNSLPKSGGWLNSVKVVLGFLELGLAFKFLSNADLVIQAGLLQREVFIAIWIAVAAMITLYLLGFIQMPHDSPIERISVARAVLATLFMTFTIYLIPGLWGAPLKLISGFPPPMFYSEAPNGFGAPSTASVQHGAGDQNIPEGADPSHCPHNLNCFHDYEMGLAYAKEVDKPIMLDFTGWACVNCRKMEETVWSDPRVLEMLSNDFVLISLYVDEKTPLPANEVYVSEETGKKVKTIGNKWADFQIKHFKSNSQPQYVITGHENLEALNGSAAYDPDIEKYIHWLEAGKKTFEAKH